MLKPERRIFRDGLQIKQREGGKLPTICGYAAVFYDPNDAGTEFEIMPGLRERIMPGAFDRALREDDVRALFNHEPTALLGRNLSGTLRLSVDKRGLRYEIDPPDTATAREVCQLIERGDISGSSFCFMSDDTTFREVGKDLILERNAVKVFDVGPVTFPAYEGTDVGVRSLFSNAEQEVAEYRKKATPTPTTNATAAMLRARVVEIESGN